MKKIIILLVFMLVGCNANNEIDVSEDGDPSVDVSKPFILDEDELEFFGDVSILGDEMEVYQIIDFDPNSREEVEFVFADTSYSFLSNTLFIFDEEIKSIEEYVQKDNGVYILSQLVEGGVPITFEFSVDESSWILAEDEYSELEGVGIQSEYEVYLEGTENVRVRWSNTLSDMISYGEPFSLQKFVDGDWKHVEKNDGMDYGFNLPAYPLQTGERWQTYSLNMFTHYLTAGKYRIVSDFHCETLDGEDYGPGNYPRYYAITFFEVSDHSIKRDLNVFNQEGYYFTDDALGIAMLFDATWEDSEVAINDIDESNPNYDLFKTIDVNSYEFRISNMDDTLVSQDIVFVVIDHREWNSNVYECVNGDFDLLPERISSRKVILLWDEYYYDTSLDSYQELLELIENIELY